MSGLIEFRNLQDFLTEFLDFAAEKHSPLGSAVPELIAEVVTERELRRWRTGRSRPSRASLLRLAERTGVPFEVLLLISNDVPVLYDLVSRRLAFCPFDNDAVNKSVLRTALLRNEASAGQRVSSMQRTDLREIVARSRRILPSSRQFPEQFLARAAKHAPTFNLVVRDSNGLVSGHLITVPLINEGVTLVLDGPDEEDQLTPRHLCETASDKLAGMHIYSLYASRPTVLYLLLGRLAEAYAGLELHLRSRVLTRCVATPEAEDVSRKMEMMPVGISRGPRVHGITPKTYSIEFGRMKWLSTQVSKWLALHD